MGRAIAEMSYVQEARVLELVPELVLPSNRTQFEVSSDSVRKCRGSVELDTTDSNELGCAN